MIAALIRWSVANRFLVLLATVMVAAVGVWSVRQTPLDAIPDLSDTQVIIRTTYPGQAPQIVEDQVTYPLTTTMLSVPGAKVVRGYSFFGDSFVYVLFEDGTDIYFARSRVLEYLNQVQGRLPPGAKPSLGPDATGVGWIYEYALVDRTGRNDLAQLRTLQDWFLKYELKTVPDVAEVASIGGMVKQYQIVLDPARLKAYNLPVMRVIAAIRDANREFGGSVLELAEAEYMVRVKGYLRTLDDFRRIPVKTSEGGTPVLLADIARIQLGPEMRRGIAELGGEGEARAAEAGTAAGRRDRRDVRPLGADRARGVEPARQACRGVRGSRRRLSRIPAPPALGAGRRRVAAARRARRVHRHACAGCERRHHVARRHRDRDRRDGRRGDRDGRERAQEARGVEARARRRAFCGRALEADRRRIGRSRSRALLQPADHHALVRAGVRARSAGGPDVQAARVHEDVCDGGFGCARRHARSRVDGLRDPWPHPGRARESADSLAHRRVPAAAALGAAVAEDDARARGGRARRDRLSGDEARWRVHAAA